MPITMQRTLLLIGCLLSAVSLALAADNAAISTQHPMSGEELTGLLENSLRNLWKIQDGTLTVEFERNLPPISLPPGEPSLRWTTQIQQPNRRIYPQFEIRVDGQVAASLAIPIRVKWIREVWVTDSPILSQVVLSANSLQKQSLDVLSLPGSAWSGDPIADDWMTSSPIPAGGVLMERSLRRRPAIRRGDTISARLEDGALSVEFQAIALEDGFKGGTMKLRSALKPVELKGKVINETIVVVVR
ncbi:MAG: flagellar basal body P-ring formation protein FlgA [Pedosphaera sp.]|jgi:flagella basal body P-ring formation protein FlgA|nr:flagellar basal body P-ring formation protein FlgA [Pedosphaera sp.]